MLNVFSVSEFSLHNVQYTMCRYVTALNNLGDAYEKAKQVNEALAAYDEALNYSPNNKVASSRAEALRARV